MYASPFETSATTATSIAESSSSFNGFLDDEASIVTSETTNASDSFRQTTSTLYRFVLSVEHENPFFMPRSSNVEAPQRLNKQRLPDSMPSDCANQRALSGPDDESHPSLADGLSEHDTSAGDGAFATPGSDDGSETPFDEFRPAIQGLIDRNRAKRISAGTTKAAIIDRMRFSRSPSALEDHASPASQDECDHAMTSTGQSEAQPLFSDHAADMIYANDDATEQHGSGDDSMSLAGEG